MRRSPDVLEGIYGVSPQVFGLLFGANALSIDPARPGWWHHRTAVDVGALLTNGAAFQRGLRTSLLIAAAVALLAALASRLLTRPQPR